MLRLLVSILLRQANKNSPGEPAVWLESLQSAKWQNLTAQNGQITGTSVNGKSVYITALPACSLADILVATEMALQACEAGLTAIPSRTQARFN